MVDLNWQWAGHIARMDSNRWAKRTTDRYPIYMIRSRGRPSSRWRDDIENLVGCLWQRLAIERQVCCRLGEAFALR